MSSAIKYAKERSYFILLVHGRPIDMGEDLVYDSREHAVGAAVRLGLAVPINIWQTRPYQSFVCETVQPDPELESLRDALIPKSIWEMYLLGWKLTKVDLECGYAASGGAREGYLSVRVEKPGQEHPMEETEGYRPIGTVDEWFALWPWFHDWAKKSADTLIECTWALSTEQGIRTGKLLFA